MIDQHKHEQKLNDFLEYLEELKTEYSNPAWYQKEEYFSKWEAVHNIIEDIKWIK